jgi:hypothetical protein
MYIKIINPATNGKKAYSNKGSAAQAVNYLKKEAKDNGQQAAFFTNDKELIGAADVTQMLDSNVKGLRADDAKFYSLVISPSAEELAHIGNDDAKLRAYTREVMAAYAENFKLKSGSKLGAESLVWAAVRHDERTHRGTDAAVAEGTSQANHRKEGLQTHIHVVVSARDAEQKITLNPMSRPDRFNRVEFAATSGAIFTQRYGEVGITPFEIPKPGMPSRQAVQALVERIRNPAPAMSGDELTRREQKVGERIGRINSMLSPEGQLDKERVFKAGRTRQYDRTFYASLSRIETRATEGRPVERPYELLSTGKQPTPAAPGHGIRTGVVQVQQLIRAAQVERPSHTQDISGEDEKRRRKDRERD